MNNDPLYPYDGSTSTNVPKEVDYRILSYDSLENRRYRSLRMKQPVPSNVTRIFQERCKNQYLIFCLFISIEYFSRFGCYTSF